MSRTGFNAFPYLFLALPMATFLAGPATAQGLDPIERTYADGSRFQFYGHINKGFQTYDDGAESESYSLIDNDAFGTRFGFTFEKPLNSTTVFGTDLEFGYAPYTSSGVSVLDDGPSGSDRDFRLDRNLRISDFYIENQSFGRITFGQGWTASDGSTEQTLSGTWYFTYVGVADTAGSQIIRQTDDTLSDLTIYDAFDNYDGNGRALRLLYESPDFHGVSLATSWGQDRLHDSDVDLYDIVGRYSNEWENFSATGKLSYAWQGGDVEILSGSGSVLHGPTGLSLTVAGGRQETDEKVGRYVFSQVAWEKRLFSAGTTAISADLYTGEDVATEGSESVSFGIGAIQNFERYNTQIWALLREYQYDDPNSDYHDSDVAFAGLRFFW